MNKIKLFSVLLISAILVAVAPFYNALGEINSSHNALGNINRAYAQTSYTELPEGNDFATRVLGDAWDMSEYSDVSQYINQSGQANLLTNISVEDGVFAASATSVKDASFHLLFPGYNTAILAGKVGEHYPIKAATYKCLYIAAKIDSGPLENNSPDQMVVYWFADEKLNAGTWGQTLPGVILYPEAGAGTPTPRWKLYKVQLDQADYYQTAWQNAPNGEWKGLRIDPTLQNTTFQIDWARLTDCNAVPLTIDWTGSGPVSISIQPEGTTRDILVEASTNSNPYILDTQGLQVGSYEYIVRKDNSIVTTGHFIIKPAPIIEFDSPSPFSGDEYALTVGNPWDMGDSSDVDSVECTSYSFQNDLLLMDTPSVASQPASCRGGTVSDPKINLNTPQSANTQEFRYLNIRLYTEGPWQEVPDGWILRWIWQIPGRNAGDVCYLVSHDIPFDTGWQTISVDLHNPFNGSPIQTAGNCPSNPSWTNNPPALQFRLDPNENITGANLHQELDWVTLTKEDAIVQGSSYRVQLSLNTPWSNLDNYQLYYTTDTSQPHQHTAQVNTNGGSSLIPSAAYTVFLPMVVNGSESNPGGGNLPYSKTLYWDTSSVQPDSYYMCIDVTANGSTANYCSEATVAVE